MKFKATEVLADYNYEWVLNIDFSGSMNGKSIYFSIQDAYDREDKQEIALGMDTYYIESNSQSNGGYGGIKKIELTREKLKITVETNLGNDNNLTEDEKRCYLYATLRNTIEVMY